MFVLDTNVVSELRRPDRAHAHVVTWARNIALAQLYLSALTVLELELGILRMERKDPRQGAELRAWMERQVLPEFAGRILPLDTTVARRCASLHVPDPVAERDAMIAATVLVHGMTLVTRNVRDFQRTGVTTLNPWIHTR
jgi:predicted nucleic acid-binding protein